MWMSQLYLTSDGGRDRPGTISSNEGWILVGAVPDFQMKACTVVAAGPRAQVEVGQRQRHPVRWFGGKIV